VNAEDKKGQGPLHIAVLEGHIDVVEMLISKGSDVNKALSRFSMDYGYTPLHLAAHLGHMEVAELLITKGADLNTDSKRGTPLHLAVSFGHEDVAELLRKHGGHE